MKKITFRHFRIFILLCILVYVAADQYLAEKRSRSWQDTLDVIIYPINGDNSTASQQTIDKLSPSRFASVEQFMQQEIHRYGLAIKQPIHIQLAPQILKKPPALPDLDEGIASIMWWSLQMRWWAFVENTYTGDTDIRLFIEYYADEVTDSHVSVGLQKGLLSLIKNYTGKTYIERNNVIIAHEMLHTLGAIDKYDPITLLPIYPDGYADPTRGENQTQEKAELMAGRIPISSDIAIVPNSLDACTIGKLTAKEIGWIKE